MDTIGVFKSKITGMDNLNKVIPTSAEEVIVHLK